MGKKKEAVIPENCRVIPENYRKFVDEFVIAETFGCAVQTLRANRCKRQGFPYYRFSRSIRYDLNECIRIFEACRIDPGVNS